MTDAEAPAGEIQGRVGSGTGGENRIGLKIRLQKDVARDVDVKGTAGEESEKRTNEKRVSGNLRQGDGSVAAENLAEVGSPVPWKVEFVNHELGYLVVKVWPGFFLLLSIKRERKETEGKAC